MARRQVSIFINGKEVANQIKSITAEKNKLVRELNHMTIGSKEYEAQIKEIAKLTPIIDKHKKTVRGVDSVWKKAGGSIGKVAGLAGVAFTADAVISMGKELFTLGTQMEVLGAKAETVFGEAMPLVTARAKENAHQLGLTKGEYIDAAAAAADLLIPMGFTRDVAADMSTDMVDLSGALSEWTGGQRSAEEVATILTKAMLGEREQLKELGIAINETDVSTRLAAKGQDKLTGAALKQAKALATQELILEKTVDAQTAFENNSGTLVRRQAELGAKFREVKETLASALIPVFHDLLEIAHPIVDVIAQVIENLSNGTEPTGQYANIIQFLSDQFKIAKDRLGFFFRIIGGVINLLSGNGRKAVLNFQLAFANLGNSVLRAVNAFQRLRGASEFELIDKEKALAELREINGQLEETAKKREAVTNPSTTSNVDPNFDPTAAKARKKAAERAIKQQEKDLQKLVELTKQYEQELTDNRLSEENRKFVELERQLQEHIDKAAELEAKGVAGATEQRLALERIKQQKLDELNDQILAQEESEEAAALDAELAKIEANELAKIDKLVEMTARRDQLLEAAEKAATGESTAGQSEENKITATFRGVTEKANEFYEDLLAQTATFNAQLTAEQEHLRIDTTAIEQQRADEIAKINAELQESLLKSEQAANLRRLQITGKALGAIGSLIGAFSDAVGNESKELLIFQRAVTLAQIAVDTAAAISSLTKNSSANPANAVTGGIAGAVQFATGLTQILANIAQAKQVLSSAKVPQKYMGGYHDVIGESDNRKYRAKYIGQRTTGMLPSSPSLVLASERGAEYFVSNDSLRNPLVLNHVRAIENIRRFGGRVPQFVEGGFNNEQNVDTSSVSFDTQQTEVNTMLLKAILQLNKTLQQGIKADIPDESIININDRFKELNEASGGIL